MSTALDIVDLARRIHRLESLRNSDLTKVWAADDSLRQGVLFNVTDIDTNSTDIDTNSTDIATNATDIGTNSTDIATNATDIGTNSTDIGTNSTDIGTNSTDIGTNSTDIDTLEALTDPSTWTGVTFANSWVNYGAGFQEVQYRKIGDIVYVRGLMKSGTVGSSAFTLPSGFRPDAKEVFYCRNSQEDSEVNVGSGRVDITSTGTVTLGAGGSPLNTWQSLAGIQFSVTA